MNKRYIGSDCFMCYSSRAELVRSDESMRVALTATEYKVLLAFVDNFDKPLKLDDLATLLWGSNYNADKKDPDSIKSHISRIRSKLSQISPSLKNRFETNHGYNTYTFKADCNTSITDCPSVEDMDSFDVYSEIELLDHRMNILVEKLEKLQEKIDAAKYENSSIWVRVYSAQFQTTFSLVMSLQEEAEEKRRSARILIETNTYAAPKRIEGTIACTQNTMMLAKRELSFLKDWVDEAVVKAELIESQLDEAISEYLINGSYSYEFLENILQELPLTREVAVALYSLTESYDGMLELYEVLFDKYTRFLTNHELTKIIERAKNVWDPIIWQKWEV